MVFSDLPWSSLTFHGLSTFSDLRCPSCDVLEQADQARYVVNPKYDPNSYGYFRAHGLLDTYRGGTIPERMRIDAPKPISGRPTHHARALELKAVMEAAVARGALTSMACFDEVTGVAGRFKAWHLTELHRKDHPKVRVPMPFHDLP